MGSRAPRGSDPAMCVCNPLPHVLSQEASRTSRIAGTGFQPAGLGSHSTISLLSEAVPSSLFVTLKNAVRELTHLPILCCAGDLIVSHILSCERDVLVV